MNMLRIRYFVAENKSPKYLLAETFYFLHACAADANADNTNTNAHADAAIDDSTDSPTYEIQNPKYSCYVCCGTKVQNWRINFTNMANSLQTLREGLNTIHNT
jgi:hypothetical protein